MFVQEEVLNARNQKGATPLKHAARQDSKEMMRLLIDSGADASTANDITGDEVQAVAQDWPHDQDRLVNNEVSEFDGAS